MQKVIDEIFDKHDTTKCGKIFPEVILFKDGVTTCVAKVVKRQSHSQAVSFAVVEGLTGWSAEGNGTYRRDGENESYPSFKQDGGGFLYMYCARADKHERLWHLGQRSGLKAIWASKIAK